MTRHTDTDYCPVQKILITTHEDEFIVETFDGETWHEQAAFNSLKLANILADRLSCRYGAPVELDGQQEDDREDD